MRKRPILFTGENVNRILADQKWQTRRVLRGFEKRGHFSTMGLEGGRFGAFFHDSIPDDPCPIFVPSPFGSRGDRLWVKETFAIGKGYDADPAQNLARAKISEIKASKEGFRPKIWYRADEGDKRPGRGQWRPSIFMPEWASRVELEIVRVWVERLNAISEADARAEGVLPFFTAYPGIGRDQRITSGELARDAEHRASYAVLWDSINDGDAGSSWKANPWVWCIEFSRREA